MQRCAPVILASSQDASLGKFTWKVLLEPVAWSVSKFSTVGELYISLIHHVSRGQGERVPQWLQLQQRTVIKSTKLPLLKLWFSPWKSSQVEPSKIYPMVSGFWSSLGLAPNFGKLPKTVDPVEPISKRPGHHKSQHWAPSLAVSWLQTNGWPPATEGAWHKHQWHLSNWWIPHEKNPHPN